MITPTECRIKARDARLAGFRILAHRDRMIEARDVGDEEYPGWVRGMDRWAGELFSEATKYERLADGSFLVRLFWKAER